LSTDEYLDWWATRDAIGSLDDLIQHGLNALRDTLQQDKALTKQNTSIGIVGVTMTGKAAKFRTLDDEAVEPYLEEMKRRQGAGAEAEAGAGDDNDQSGGSGGAAMAVEGESSETPAAGAETVPEQSGANAPSASDGDGDVQMQGWSYAVVRITI
jgi:hypothetical protein